MTMNKKTVYIVGAIVLVLLAVFVIDWKGGVLGDTPEIIAYTGTGEAMLYVPFDASTEERFTLSASIDLNSDGAFGDDERVIVDLPAYPDDGWRAGYPFPVAGDLPEEVAVQITLSSGETFVGTANVLPYDPEALLDSNTSTNPNGMKAGAGDGKPGALHNGVPDLTQRIAECAPTAAANSIMALAERNGKSISDLPNPTDIVNGLKGAMDWTPENGVSPDNFVAGKDRYMAQLGFPIRTTFAGGDDGRGTIQELKEALDHDKAAEVQLKFTDPATGRGTGSHMVTVVSIEEVDGATMMRVNDPNTPAGTEIYDVSTGEMERYPSRWSVTFGWGFVQTWEGTPTGTALDPMTEEEIGGIQDFVGEKEMVEVIVYQGAHIPVATLHIGKVHAKHQYGEGCDQTHWHADAPVKSLEGATYADPNPGGCGFGKTSQVQVVQVPKP